MLGRDCHQIQQRNSFWKIVWTARVIPKVKIFMWRLLHNILPTAENLRMKGVNLQGGCLVCGHSDETAVHIMFQCKLSKEVWSSVCPRLMENVDRFVGQTIFWQSIFDWLVQEDVLEQCMITCWQLWCNRNQCLHGHVCRTSTTIAGTVGRLLEDFKAVYIQESSRAIIKVYSGLLLRMVH